MKANQKKKNPLRNDAIGINEYDVAECYDRDTLIDWRTEIDIELSTVKESLRRATEADGIGEDSSSIDMDWYNRAVGYRTVQGMLIKRIDMQLTKIKSESKGSCTDVSREIDRFYDMSILEFIVFKMKQNKRRKKR